MFSASNPDSSIPVNFDFPLCGLENDIPDKLFLVVRMPNFLATKAHDHKIMLPCFQSEELGKDYVANEYPRHQEQFHFTEVSFEDARQIAKNLKQTVALLVYNKEGQTIHYVK